jgi:hypothetical protein
MATSTQQEDDGEARSTTYTFITAITGLVALVVCFLVASFALGDETDIGQSMNAAMAPVTGVIGTIVGLMAGQHVGATGRRSAEKRANALATQMANKGETMMKYEGMLRAQGIDPATGQRAAPSL